MGLKPSYNEGFANPEPSDNCLFRIKTVRFDKDEKSGGTICLTNYEIIDCSDVPENVGMSTGEYFGLFEKNEKWFGTQLFIGFLHKVTGDLKDVDGGYFDDVKVQSKIEKMLPDMIFGGSIVHTKDKNDPNKVYANVQRYRSKEEYKEASKRTTNSTGAGAPAPNAADAPPGGSSSGW